MRQYILLSALVMVVLAPTPAAARELTAAQLEAAQKLVNIGSAPSRTLNDIVRKMSPRQRSWLVDAIDRYQALREQPPGNVPLGSVRTDLPDGRWAWQIVAGPRTVTIAVKRSGRATVTSMRTPTADVPQVRAPFTLSQASVVKMADSQGKVNVSQWADTISHVSMQGVAVPRWNAIGKPSTRADFRQQPRPVSPRKAAAAR